ncbi:MAG TPA: TRAP transporter substrate-binding protein [Burkholderiales bacterium]|nr:TRAP transporter substrate-binding protein [Burkholderiales bacterium]
MLKKFLKNQAQLPGDSSASRRKFLSGATAVAATGVLAACGREEPPKPATSTPAMPQAPSVAVKPSTVVLKMQGAWGAKDIFNEMAEQYVTRVNAMAGGRLRIDYLVAGAVVKPFEVMDATSKGVLDAAHSVPVYWYGKHKAASLFGTGPVFGNDAHHTIAWFYQGGGQALYDELVQKQLNLNVVGFLVFPMPTQPFGWFKTPIKDAAGLKGLKYRTVGLAADLFQAMGAKVTQLPGGEIVPALERGVIDAFEFNNPTSDMRFGAQDVIKNYMMGSYHQASESFEILFNKTKYDALPADLKAILRYGVEAVNSANFWLAMENYSRDLQILKDKHKVNVIRTPDSIMLEQLKAWDTLTVELSKDPVNKKIIDSQRAWFQRVVFYEQLNAANYKLAYEHVYKTKLG